jgi:hypothetical protein
MMKAVQSCVSRGMNFEQSQIIVRASQGVRSHPAKLPNQLRSKSSVHIERVNIISSPPKSGWFRFLVKQSLRAFTPVN